MKYGIASFSLFQRIKMIEYLTSTFIIPCSIFDIFHPVYFAETFGQSNLLMFIAYFINKR